MMKTNVVFTLDFGTAVRQRWGGLALTTAQQENFYVIWTTVGYVALPLQYHRASKILREHHISQIYARTFYLLYWRLFLYCSINRTIMSKNLLSKLLACKILASHEEIQRRTSVVSEDIGGDESICRFSSSRQAPLTFQREGLLLRQISWYVTITT